MGKYKVQKIYKHKVLDATMTTDPTYENYMALLTAILIDEDAENYKTMVYNKSLFDKEEERKRIKEIDEIRANGGQTELEIWYKNSSINGDDKRKERAKNVLSKIIKKKHERNLVKKEGYFKKYKDEIADISTMAIGEIAKFKVKTINVITGEVVIYNNRKECSEATGIRRKAITTYIKKARLYKSTYIFTVANERVSKEEFNRIMLRTVKIKATNITTGEEKIFNRFQDISDFLNMNNVTFQQKFRYKNITEFNGWKIEELEKE